MDKPRGVYQPAGLYISKQQAAELIGKKPRDIQYYITHHNLRAYKIDTRWSLNKDDVLNFKIPKPGPKKLFIRKKENK